MENLNVRMAMALSEKNKKKEDLLEDFKGLAADLDEILKNKDKVMLLKNNSETCSILNDLKNTVTNIL